VGDPAQPRVAEAALAVVDEWQPESGWRQLLDALRAAARGELTFGMIRAG
jgi:hypothetical protein